jgi:hydrogenase maturation protease
MPELSRAGGEMKTLVVGLGNPILSDDGVGMCVVEALEGKINQKEVTVTGGSVSGLSLLELLAGYDRAIIIDAIQTVGGQVGQIYKLDPAAFDFTRHAASPHDVNFTTALELGRRLGLPQPQQIIIFAIEVADVNNFSEKCTGDVRRAIPVCVEMVLHELNEDSVIYNGLVGKDIPVIGRST